MKPYVMWFGPGWVGAWHKRDTDQRTRCGLDLPATAVATVGFDAEDMAATAQGRHETYCPFCFTVAPARRIAA